MLKSSLFPGRPVTFRFLFGLLQALAAGGVLKGQPFGFNGFSIRSLTELAILLLLAVVLQTALRQPWDRWVTLHQGLGPRLLLSIPIRAPDFLLPLIVAAIFITIPRYLREPAQPKEPSKVYELADWARTNTPVDSVFLFPDAGQSKLPGYFRYRSQRAVYVDWKGGGQVNFSRRFAVEWWHRWRVAISEVQPQGLAMELQKLPVDFVVTGLQSPIPELRSVHRTDTYNVYSVR